MTNTQLETTVNGEVVRFDVRPADVEGLEPVSRRSREMVVRLERSLDEALDAAKPAAEAVIATFRALSPNELTVEFGLRLDAKSGAVFAEAGAGMHFRVSATWKHARTAGGGPGGGGPGGGPADEPSDEPAEAGGA